MKTTKLMTAFALSAMFAACSQDAELNEVIAKNDFSNIPVVEAEFTVNTGVDSRMATKFGWEVGDKVGFAWLGDGTTIAPNGMAYQNHPLFCTNATNAAFKTETMLYVGKYYAYMPYTAGNMTVEAVKFNVNAQTLSTNSDDLAKSAIYISPALTSLQKPNQDGSVASGNQKAGMGNNLPLTIARVSNAATINLNLVNTAALTDLKITGISLNAKASGNSVLPKEFTYAPTANASNSNWANVPTSEFYAPTQTSVTAGAIVATNANGIAVPADGKLTVYMLTMPVTAAQSFEVTISTNYGDVFVDNLDTYGDDNDPCIAFTEGTTAKTLTNVAMLNKFGSASTMDVYADMSDILVKDATVTSQTALMNKLNMIVTADYDGEVEITLNPNNANKKGNYVFTDFTLPANLKSKITIKAGNNVPNGFVFEGNTVINKEIVLDVNSTVKGTMTVNSVYRDYAYQTVLAGSGKITVAKGSKLVNNGIIESNILTEAGDSANSWVNGRYVSNATTANATGTFTNNGEIKWIAGTLPVNASGLIFAEVTDFASLNNAEVHGVTTARFVNDVVFSNGGRDVTIGTNIKKIEILGEVVMNITKDDITGNAKTIEFKGLSGEASTPAELEIMTGASLTIASDFKTNVLKFGSSANVYTNRNSILNISKLTVQNLGELKYNGNVVTTNVNLGAATLVADTYGQYTNSK